MEAYSAQGHFASGSMGPKVEAALRFVRSGGQRSIITALDRIAEALDGESGPSSRGLHLRSPDRLNQHSTTTAPPTGRMNTVPEPIEVRKVPIHSVADASELAKLIDDGVMEADRVIAIIGKTEGNGGVNDYTRIIADRAFREVLVEKGAPADQVRQVPIVWSGGTDGVISPHATIFATVPADKAEQSDDLRLTVGFAMSEPIKPEEIGYVAMVKKVADGVKVAMEKAGITDPADVHYVQTKTPLLTIHTIRDAKSRGMTGLDRAHPRVDGPVQRHDRPRHRRRARRDRDADRRGRHAQPRRSTPRSPRAPRASSSTRRRSSSSATPAASAGATASATRSCRTPSTGRHLGGHQGRRPRPAGAPALRRDLDGRLVNVFLKCEVSQDGTVHGRRNAMLDDSDVHWHRQIKSAVGGVTASVTGDPAVFVSVSAAHQGPDGGGPVAAIVDLGEGEPTGYRWTR